MCVALDCQMEKKTPVMLPQTFENRKTNFSPPNILLTKQLTCLSSKLWVGEISAL